MAQHHGVDQRKYNRRVAAKAAHHGGISISSARKINASISKA
jgi:hypothetical protein